MDQGLLRQDFGMKKQLPLINPALSSLAGMNQPGLGGLPGLSGLESMGNVSAMNGIPNMNNLNLGSAIVGGEKSSNIKNNSLQTNVINKSNNINNSIPLTNKVNINGSESKKNILSGGEKKNFFLKKIWMI